MWRFICRSKENKVKLKIVSFTRSAQIGKFGIIENEGIFDNYHILIRISGDQGLDLDEN
ncbi:hypothetical protein LEP1GSC185_0605 [Leptospira licerasiae serovar Varillal str. VAR 010]|nr:hypothetical protein LEP1GSC185_0605 [Leptospira licerasiae serovar Varillal str. VAR 010]